MMRRPVPAAALALILAMMGAPGLRAQPEIPPHADSPQTGIAPTWRDPDATVAVPWRNPDAASGSSAATPPHTPALPPSTAQECREYQQSVIIDGTPRQAYGTACRQPDGTWRPQR
jgi:hypothetical protein